MQVYLPSVTLLPDLVNQLPDHQPALGAIRTFKECINNKGYYCKIVNELILAFSNFKQSYFI
jgi:hypothetical protein